MAYDRRMNRTPRYIQIREYLRRQMDEGQLRPGDRIPTEAQLCEQFAVSRMTVNKAVRDLVREGRLLRRARAGTIVQAPRAESPLHAIRNIAEEVRQRGHVYQGEVLVLEAVTADPALADALRVPVGEPLYHSRIIHKENGLPIQLEDRHVLAACTPGYLEQDFSRNTPNAFLTRLCPAQAVEHRVEAVLPDKQQAEWLGIEASEPCLRVLRRTWADDRLMSYAELLHPGSRYSLRSISGPLQPESGEPAHPPPAGQNQRKSKA